MSLETGSFSASRRRFWSGRNSGFPGNSCTQSNMNATLSNKMKMPSKLFWRQSVPFRRRGTKSNLLENLFVVVWETLIFIWKYQKFLKIKSLLLKIFISIYVDIELLSIYFITVNKYRFCISIIGYIKVQIIGIGYKKSKSVDHYFFQSLDYENDQFEWFSILRELFL